MPGFVLLESWVIRCEYVCVYSVDVWYLFYVSFALYYVYMKWEAILRVEHLSHVFLNSMKSIELDFCNERKNKKKPPPQQHYGNLFIWNWGISITVCVCVVWRTPISLGCIYSNSNSLAHWVSFLSCFFFTTKHYYNTHNCIFVFIFMNWSCSVREAWAFLT